MARGGTPLGFGAPSLEASYQSQIDDLVQRNRTLEHTNKKLADQVAQEKVKGSEVIAEAQKHWRQEQLEWRQGCDVLQSCHRVVQLQNVLQLEQERMNILKEQDVTRKEKLLRLQRDFRITMFQAREAELEDKIRDLEEDREDLIADFEEAGRQHDQRSAEYVATLDAKNEEIAVYEGERAELQVEMAPVMVYNHVDDTVAKLREKHARLEGDGDKNLRELERVTLQRDGLVTARDELQRNNDELTRSKADLVRQLEKWQKLENKNEAEVEAERQKRVNLDIQLQELQTQQEISAEEHEKQLRKEKRRVEKLKEANEVLQAAAEKHDEEIEAASAKLAKAERKIARLKDALEAERARTRSPSPRNSIDENEVVPQAPPEPSTKPRPRRAQSKPSTKTQTTETAIAEAGPSSMDNTASEKVTRKKRKTVESDVEEVPKPKPKPKPSRVEERDDKTEKVPQKSEFKGKGKAKATEATDDIVEVPPPSDSPKPGRKTKRKVRDGEENDSATAKPPAKTKVPFSSQSRDASEVTTNTRRRPPSPVGSASARPSLDEQTKETSDTEKEPAKKKRRKINIFHSSATPFTFESIVWRYYFYIEHSNSFISGERI
ncbi:hypothetical protein C0992_004457 [Termitomyces sp. T32_za158]|nr:hypothetical protein C0992_004457 [Termitomyces sp. T32_za158]